MLCLTLRGASLQYHLKWLEQAWPKAMAIAWPAIYLPWDYGLPNHYGENDVLKAGLLAGATNVVIFVLFGCVVWLAATFRPNSAGGSVRQK